MKIALIIRRLSGPGGAQRVVLSLAREFKKMGHEVVCYAFDIDGAKCFPELINQFKLVALPKDNHLNTGGTLGFLNEAKMARELARMIESDTDILFPTDGPAHQTAYFYKKERRNIRSVWNMNELPTMRWPLELLDAVENADMHDIPRRPLWLKKISILARTAYEKKFIRTQDAIVVFDQFHRDLLRRYVGVDAHIIPSGNDPAIFAFGAHFPPGPSECLRLLTSGIFLPYRRFEDTIKALKILVDKKIDAELTILGDESPDRKYARELRNLAFRLGVIKRVEFRGRYSDKELNGLLASSHMFLYPHMQSQGIAVNEAIAAGLPTIVTPLPGTYETLTEGKHALFAEPRNPASLADAILRLMSDSALYRRISQEGAEYMRRFSWKRQAEELMKIFNIWSTKRLS